MERGRGASKAGPGRARSLGGSGCGLECGLIGSAVQVSTFGDIS